jgi:hypothetical protein
MNENKLIEWGRCGTLSLLKQYKGDLSFRVLEAAVRGNQQETARYLVQERAVPVYNLASYYRVNPRPWVIDELLTLDSAGIPNETVLWVCLRNQVAHAAHCRKQAEPRFQAIRSTHIWRAVACVRIGSERVRVVECRELHWIEKPKGHWTLLLDGKPSPEGHTIEATNCYVCIEPMA